jgi:hypothetical protein
MNMLKNPEINEVKRGDMAKAIIDLKAGVEVIREILKMVKYSELYSSPLERYIIKTIGPLHPDSEIIYEMV